MKQRIIEPLTKLIALCQRLPMDVLAIGARLALVGVFWKSAQTKIHG